ncbi:hypothetical protein Q31b_44130 [Novipirellula aureliae]|uniref:Transposase IS200-like domain-containing protein n=1 Tax=Novipirellula aureliae TaxID=2527966 RepID=A0A5C6DN85_9BACT|nr:hypothetical protein [Novipirellula aureliae]TWU37625.1 hypothetical protein Q31b_44130 [Novipirellula aureliae]
MDQSDIQTFSRNEEFTIFDRHLPHWGQSGTLCFITWRLNDSLPKAVLDRLDAELSEVHRSFDIGSKYPTVASLPIEKRTQCYWDEFAVRDRFLDRGLGNCLLRKPEHAEAVLESLLRFDVDRYFLTDAVVMPNHAHFIAAFPATELMLFQCENWKRFTGRRINKSEGQTGEFWQVDQFDHLIRTDDYFEYFRRYIAENPIKANLQKGEFLHYQKKLDQ